MAPPPSTPAPRRFLLPKRQGTQGLSQTPSHVSSSSQQFRATPRFSLPSTPGQPGSAQPQRRQLFATPHPSSARARPHDSDPIRDALESSPRSPAGLPTAAAHPLDDSIEIESDRASSRASESSEPARKKRRFSASPVLDESSLPATQELSAGDSDYDVIRGSDDDKDDSGRDDDLDRDAGSAADDGSRNDDEDLGSVGPDDQSSSPVIDIAPHEAGQVQPIFHRAPRFKAPATLGAAQLCQLPDAFSPQRRGAKYVPGGLAAELRDWLVAVKGHGDADEMDGMVAEVVVEESTPGHGSWLIHARPGGGGPGFGNAGSAAGQPVLKIMLAGEGRMSGLGRKNVIRRHSVVAVYQPIWDIELQGLGDWTVACDWGILSD